MVMGLLFVHLVKRKNLIMKSKMILSLFFVNFLSLNLQAHESHNKKENDMKSYHSNNKSSHTKTKSHTKKENDTKSHHENSKSNHAKSMSHNDPRSPMDKELIENFIHAVDDVFLQDRNKCKAHIEKAIEAFKKIRTARKIHYITKEESEQIKNSAKKLFGSMTKKKAMEYNIK